jgi:hypothetical protein
LVATVCLLNLSQDSNDVGALIEELGSDRPEVRERASNGLTNYGNRARAQLLIAQEDSNPERSKRAAEILERMDRVPGSLIAYLGRLADRRREDYHRLLRDAAHWVQEVVVGKDWNPLRAGLRANNAILLDSRFWWGSGHNATREYDYLLLKDAYRSPGGQSHDLCLAVVVDPTLSPDAVTRLVVRSADIGLRASFKSPLDQAGRKAAYRSGTVLEKLLNSATLRDKSSPDSTLEELYVWYSHEADDYDFMGLDNACPWRFHIRVVVSSSGGLTRRYVRLRTPSGLDSPVSRSGQPAWERFASQDTVGEFSVPFRGRGCPMDASLKTWALVRKESVDAHWERQRQLPFGGEIAQSVPDLESLPADTSELKVDLSRVSAADLERISRLANLQVLQFEGCQELDERGLVHLGRLLRLSKLTLPGMISDEGVASLAKLPALKDLGFSLSITFGEAGFESLGRLDSLTSLRLGSDRLTNEKLRHLGRLKNLVHLSIGSGSAKNDCGLDFVSELSHLERLHVGGFQAVTVEQMASLSRLGALQSLSLAQVNLEDKHLDRISEIRTLTSLELHWLHEITDLGILNLAKLPNLKDLHIEYCSKPSPAGIVALQKAMGEGVAVGD